MKANDPSLNWPAELEIVSNGSRTRYTIDRSLLAVHGKTPQEGASIVFRFADEGIVVLRDTVATTRLTKTGPVYRIEGGDVWAVPTGCVFVRFEKSESVVARADELAKLGFSIEKVPSYAPHAAWIRPRSEAIGDALLALARLRELPRIRAVEPELLSPRVWR